MSWPAKLPGISLTDHGPARVVHCRRESLDVYIGRPSFLGNPFRIGPDGTRADVIAKYKRYLLGNPDLLRRLPELRGKTLGCWCAPQPCHGDVLMYYANAAAPEMVVTGSRDWTSPRQIQAVLLRANDIYGRHLVQVNGRCDPWSPVTRKPVRWEAALELPLEEQRELLGADWQAARIGERLGWHIEYFAADWNGPHGKAAGFVRNAVMAARPQVVFCAAFLMPCTKPCDRRAQPHPSHGGSHCAKCAETKGVPVRRWRPDGTYWPAAA